jgi:rifampicin phosphotransferase
VSAHSALLIPLAVAESLRECGAKAVNLARLTRLGYLVPSGMVVIDRAFQSHLRHARVERVGHALLSGLPALKPGEIRARSAAIRAKVRDTSIEPRLRHHLGLAYETAWRGKRLAVRSSALGEDGRAASFAGQLDSVLGVESYADLEEAIRGVWASIWSERCLAYASRNGCSELRMGVVVQEQVNARYSGVLFTRNPLAAPQDGHAVIEYVTGLGSRLAAGEVTPDRVLVRHSDLAVIRDAATEMPAGQGLADAILAELGLIGLELEQRLAAPQDIEWSVNTDNAIVLLQARPITSTGHGAHRDMWSNANIAENFPDVVSPFLYSVVSAGYTAYFRNLGRSFGISRQRLDAMSEAFASIVGAHAGRLYYNLSNIHTTICLMPGGRTLARWFNEFTGAREFPAVNYAPGGLLERVMELTRVAVKAAWKYLWIHRRIARFERTVERYAGATHPARLAAKDLADLAGDLRRFLDIRLHRWNDAALADTAAMVCDGLLRRMLSADSGANGYARLHGTLLSGLSGLASARPIVELWRLSREIRGDENLHRLFASATASEILERMAAPDWDAFRARFWRYLEVWGFRYSGELMLTSPTPREDPLPVIRLLQSYSREEGPGPLEISARQANARERATSTLAERLTPERWLRWLPLSRAGRFRILLRAAQGAIRLRERARMQQALLYTRLRYVVLRIGEELASRRLLESRDDVFFLEAREVLALSAAAGPAAATRETVRQRREQCARWATQQPPDSFALGRGEQWCPDARVAPAAARGLDGESLRGTSACGGLVEGNAAVVLDVTEADRLCAGDILVTRQTDPGWATVFFLIKGLVIERGGMLSHGAIIAREYGIPAVVGVPEATRRIRPGDRVRVDGDHGVIEFCRG